jgi:glucose/arabinose dehydrogenase
MSRRSTPIVVALFLACSGAIAPAAATPAAAATLPAGFTDNLVTSLGAPTDLAFVPGSQTIMLTSQPGQVRLYNPNFGNLPIVLDLSSRLCSNSERGLLGIVLDPAFASNHFVYLYYTFVKAGCIHDSATTPVNRVSRFVLGDNDKIDKASETVLIDIRVLQPAGPGLAQPDGRHPRRQRPGCRLLGLRAARDDPRRSVHAGRRGRRRPRGVHERRATALGPRRLHG